MEQFLKFLFFSITISFIINLPSPTKASPKQNETSKDGKEDDNLTCNFYFENKDAVEKAFNDCVDKLDLKGKVPEFNTSLEEADKYFDKLKKAQYDDKCLVKCMMDKFNMITKDGLFNRKEFHNFHKGNMTKEATMETFKMWNSCADKIESMPAFDPKTNQEDEKLVCKRMAAFDECWYKKGQELKFTC